MTNEITYNQAREELKNYSLEELKQNFDLKRDMTMGCMESVMNPDTYQRNRAAQDLAKEKGLERRTL